MEEQMEQKVLDSLRAATSGLKYFAARTAVEPGERGAAAAGLRVTLEGMLDADAAAAATGPLVTLIEQWDGAPRLVIMLEQLTYIASMGVGMISMAAAAARKRGIAITLRHPQPSVLNVLNLLGIPDFIPTEEFHRKDDP
jgi:anti-anti-sigma factor